MRVGDIITATHGFAERAGSDSYQSTLTVQPDTQLRVTRIFAERIIVRGRFNISGEWRDASVYLPYDRILTVNSQPYVAQDGVRRLGQKPDDTDEMTYIGIDHPGLQWLFEDMAAYADNQRWCGEYDALCIRLGLPARPRDFTVSLERGGITIMSTVKARSQAEANQMVADALAQAGTE